MLPRTVRSRWNSCREQLVWKGVQRPVGNPRTGVWTFELFLELLSCTSNRRSEDVQDRRHGVLVTVMVPYNNISTVSRVFNVSKCTRSINI